MPVTVSSPYKRWTTSPGYFPTLFELEQRCANFCISHESLYLSQYTQEPILGECVYNEKSSHEWKLRLYRAHWLSSLSHAIYYNYVRREHTLSVTGHLQERHV